MLKRFCDSCGKEIAEIENEAKVIFKFRNTERFIFAKHIKGSIVEMLEREIDICNNCIVAAFSDLDTRPRQHVEPCVRCVDKDKPVADEQWKKLSTPEDDDVIGKLITKNSLFDQLFRGDYHGKYQSQSEADYDFICILAVQTQDKEQIKRIFRNSALGFREKAKRDDYVNGMIEMYFNPQLAVIVPKWSKE